MKKLILLAVAIIFAGAIYGQQVKINKTFVIATRGIALGEEARIGDFVYIKSDSTLYVTKVALGRAATGTYLLADGSRYAIVNKSAAAGTYLMNQNVRTTDAVVFATVNTGQGANELYDMDQNVMTTSSVTFGTLASTATITASGNIESGEGIVGVSGNFSTKVYVADSVSLPSDGVLKFRDQTLSRTNDSKVTFNNSVAAGDTVFAAVVSTTGNILGLGTTSHLSGAGAGAATGILTLSSNGTPQLVLNDLDAADAQEPMWYLQSANNATKGIFYLGYGDRSAGTTMTGYTDVLLLDATSATLGTAIGSGTGTLYAGNVTVGAQAITQVNDNKATFNNSLLVTDTLFAPVVSASSVIITPKLKLTATDTTGVGSTATLGTIMFHIDGAFYGLAGTTTPTWTALH